MANISPDDRRLNLATILLGEALAQIGNIRQRGGVPGTDYNSVLHTLNQATAALAGTAFVPQVDPQHIQNGRGK